MTVNLSISDAYDGGNIKFISQETNANDPRVLDVSLHIKPDVRTELEHISHMQYFSFRVMVCDVDVPQRVNYIIANAGKASYPDAWPGSTVCYSSNVHDPDSWKRKEDTFYTNGCLSWEHVHDKNDHVYFSFFPPFSYGQHLDLIAKCAASGNANVSSLGQSIQGREIEYITAGSGPLHCWIIHRQHPGEVMAEFFAEGLLTRLLGLDGTQVDEQATRLLKLYTFHIVPCMCPDGAVLGHLRCNAVGANLNREWADKGPYIAPTKERSPEVYYVLKKMDETGVDAFFDIHGDEELPYNFMAGCENVPAWGTRLQSLHGAFVAAYSRANSDMQRKIGYPPISDPIKVLNYMNIAMNQVGNRFNCLSLVLEMPFKDCDSNPDPERGWTPARSRKLGASILAPLEYIQPYLRAEGQFWKDLPPEDAYVEPTDDYEESGIPKDEEFVRLHQRFYSDVHEVYKADMMD